MLVIFFLLLQCFTSEYFNNENIIRIMTSLYDILMTNIHATQLILRENYLKLTRMYNPNSKSGCYEKYLDVVRAYNILKDIYMRNYYDNFGDKGLESLNDNRKTYFLTRTFDSINLRLATFVLVILIMNITFLPIAFHLHISYKLSFTIIFKPMMMALILVGIFVIRAIMHFKQYKVEKLLDEMLYVLVIGVVAVLTLLQIIFMCYVVDCKVQSYRYLWMIPCTLLEIILSVQGIINNPDTCKETFIRELPRIFRLAILHIFVVDFPMQYKVFIPLIIISIELLMRGLSYKTTACVSGCVFAALCCVYSCMETKYPWLAYLIGTIFISAGVIMVAILIMTKRKYAPVCRFGEQVALEYDV